jgi:hypothetical protein
VIGLVDVITGGTNIGLNVTCGEGTAEFAKAQSTDTQAGQECNGRLGPSLTELPRLNAQVNSRSVASAPRRSSGTIRGFDQGSHVPADQIPDLGMRDSPLQAETGDLKAARGKLPGQRVQGLLDIPSR